MVLTLSFLICKMGVNYTYLLLRPRRMAGSNHHKVSVAGHILRAQLATGSCCKGMGPPRVKYSLSRGSSPALGAAVQGSSQERQGTRMSAQSPVGREGLLPAGGGSDLRNQPQSLAGGEEEGHGLLNIGSPTTGFPRRNSGCYPA